VITDFEFEDEGRCFICSVETPRHAGMPPWWWFKVSVDQGRTRYAPFEAKPSDTRQSVQKRIVKHYEEVLAIKARPVHPRPQWQKPAPRPPAPAGEITVASEAAVAAEA
jgi:hypothetical protein